MTKEIEHKIKIQMTLESDLTMEEVENLFHELKLTNWYLNVKNRIEREIALNNFKEVLFDVYRPIVSNTVDACINLYDKVLKFVKESR